MRFSQKIRRICATVMSGMLTVGLALTVGMTPVKADDDLNMNLSLNIYSIGGGAEKGQPVTVTGEGQY